MNKNISTKITLSPLRFCVMAVLLFVATSASAYDFVVVNDDGLPICYDIVSSVDKTCEVAPYNRNNNDENEQFYRGTIIIPETVEYNNVTYTVIGIGECAFSGCDMLWPSPNAIPETVTYIGAWGFYFACHVWPVREISEYKIPDSVTMIDLEAFRQCRAIKGELVLSENLTTLGYGAFFQCTEITSVVIPNSLTTIEPYTFHYCTSLTSAVISESVTTLGEQAFGDCTSLTSVYSLNPEPPVCGKSCFYKVDTNACVLYIPHGTYDAYSTADTWKDFFNIVELTPEGIEGISADGAEVVGYYTIGGKAIDTPQRGVNIVKYSDGSTKKVMYK